MIFWRRKIDWEYIKENLQDINKSIEALKKWDKKDMSEYHYNDIVIDIALENIKNEMNLK